MILALWVAVGLQVLGQVWDFVWHSARGEVADVGDQVQAHWLIWVGSAAIVAVGIAAARAGQTRVNAGLRYALIAGVILAVGNVWNFWAHTYGGSLFAPHVVMLVSRIGVLAAAILATYSVGWKESPASGFFKGGGGIPRGG